MGDSLYSPAAAAADEETKRSRKMREQQPDSDSRVATHVTCSSAAKRMQMEKDERGSQGVMQQSDTHARKHTNIQTECRRTHASRMTGGIGSREMMSRSK